MIYLGVRLYVHDSQRAVNIYRSALGLETIVYTRVTD